MKTASQRLVTAAVAAAAILGGTAALRAQGAARSTWSGIYTEAQAARGQAAYAQNCGTCHGAQLGGTGEAPPIAGSEFASNWNGLSVGELYDRIRTTMPFDRPGQLSRDTYADVLAYVLKSNGFPAGAQELDRRSEVLAAIAFTAAKPAVVTMSRDPAVARASMFRLASYTVPAAGSSMVAMATAATGATADSNGYPNPYQTIENYLQLPAGRTMGSTSAVAVDSKGHIWVADRCGVNSCADSPLDPVMEFAADGRFLKAFGGGMFLFPHGLYIDRNDHLWLTDGHAATGKGFQVFELDQSGKVLRTLGKPGVAGDGPDVFNEPNAVLVAPDGTIFVSDGHTANKGNARILKYDRSGTFVKQWGTHGAGPGELEVPHTLAMDSRGRLFVGDRWNNRIQIYDQDGKLLDSWEQFGRPSGIFIDKKDILYVTDSESREPQGYGYHPGWRRGIRVGSARTGVVTAFIPDTDPHPEKGATSGAEGIWADDKGVIYGAQVEQRAVVRYVRRSTTAGVRGRGI